MCVMLLDSAMALAVPAQRGFHNFTQSDGSTISVEMRGDEWHHSFVTGDGLAVERADNGDFYYNTATGMSNVMAHNVADRSEAELNFINSQAEKIAFSTMVQQAAGTRARAPRKKVGTVLVPTSGSPKIPVILVQYSDKKMSNTKEQIISHFTNKVSQYFKDQSNGIYNPQYVVHGIYTLSGKRAKYGKNNGGNDIGVASMVGEAVDSANADGVNWKDYDNDNDGVCDVVMVIYAGVGEAQASQSVPDAVWPCQWDLSSGAYYGDGTGARNYSGIKIDRFGVFNEINGSYDGGTTLDGIGTFAHEFSHCLGLPDFYETTYSGYYGMGSWSLMDYGCYNNNGNTPIGYSAYEKNFMGWIDFIEPEKNTKYVLTSFNQKKKDTDKAVKIQSDLNSNEYYILEYRKKQGWDAYIRDEGVMISHVSYVASRWADNTVNNESVQLMTIFPADNQLSNSTETADLYGKTNHQLTNESKPASKLYLKKSGEISASAGMMGKPVTEINLNDDGTASFWYMKNAVNKTEPVLTDATNITATSFTAHWIPAEGAASYTLFVADKEHEPAVSPLLDETASTIYSSSDWTKSSVFTDVEGYLRLGSTKQVGSITSPTINLADAQGKSTVVVTAKSYDKDSNVEIKVSNGDVDAKTQIVTSSDAQYTFVLNGKPDASNTIKISSMAAGKRLLISSVKIYAGDVSGDVHAPLRAATETGDSTNRTITGITDTLYNVTALTNGGTFNYKVKAVYADKTESNWSAKKEVSLSTSSMMAGDIDRNGVVNMSDVTALINHILGVNDSYNATDCNLNSDDVVDVSDVTALINMILKK